MSNFNIDAAVPTHPSAEGTWAYVGKLATVRPVDPGSGIAGALAIHAARNNPALFRKLPRTTGRKIVIFQSAGAGAAVQSLAARQGFKFANSLDFVTTVPSHAAVAGADALIFQRLGVAVVNDPGHLAAIASLQPGAAIASSFDERIVYALSNWYSRMKAVSSAAKLSPDYSRGFRDGVLSTSELLDQPAPQPGSIAAQASSYDESQVTWGLQATRVVNSSRSGKGVKVAILDTGIDANHADFAGRILPAQCQSFVDNVASVQDGNGHGTHVAGTACGPVRPQNLPRYGIASDSTIYIAKVLTDEGWGYDSWFLAALEWAIQNGCQIANMSLGVPPDPVQDANFEVIAKRALDANLLIIAAVGNEGPNSPVDHPADCPSVMGVGAVDQTLSPAWFSNGGSIANNGQVDIAGPGVNVYSSWPLPLQYNRDSGTSMAAPHVSGIAALWAEANPCITAAALWQTIVSNARRLEATSAAVGAGLVQAPP